MSFFYIKKLAVFFLYKKIPAVRFFYIKKPAAFFYIKKLTAGSFFINQVEVFLYIKKNQLVGGVGRME